MVKIPFKEWAGLVVGKGASSLPVEPEGPSKKEISQSKTRRLRQLQSLPLDAKVRASEIRIRDWYRRFEGNVAVSFSGGKDSTVLLHLVRSLYPDVRAVFVDTGLEYPEIRRFVRTFDEVDWIKPKMNFRKVIEKYGWPIVSKEVAGYLREVAVARSNGSQDWVDRRLYGVRKNGEKTGYCISAKWRFLADAPFQISDKCCDVMKKAPLKDYHKLTGLVAFTGTMVTDSSLRRNSWYRHGCNSFDTTQPVSRPLSFWVEEDIWDYIRSREIPYCPIYDAGATRTGCIFCGFGAHLEARPNRFERLLDSHPKMWYYVIETLGMGEVLDHIGVPYGRK